MRIDEVAARRPQPRQRLLLVGSGQPTVSGDIGRKNDCEFACGLRHGSLSAHARLARLPVSLDSLFCLADYCRLTGNAASSWISRVCWGAWGRKKQLRRLKGPWQRVFGFRSKLRLMSSHEGGGNNNAD